MKIENTTYFYQFVCVVAWHKIRYLCWTATIRNMLKTTPFRFALVAVFLTIIGSALADDDGK